MEEDFVHCYTSSQMAWENYLRFKAVSRRYTQKKEFESVVSFPTPIMFILSARNNESTSHVEKGPL